MHILSPIFVFLHYFRYQYSFLRPTSSSTNNQKFSVSGAEPGSFCLHFTVVYSSRTMHVLFLVLLFIPISDSQLTVFNLSPFLKKFSFQSSAFL